MALSRIERCRQNPAPLFHARERLDAPPLREDLEPPPSSLPSHRCTVIRIHFSNTHRFLVDLFCSWTSLSTIGLHVPSVTPFLSVGVARWRGGLFLHLSRSQAAGWCFRCFAVLPRRSTTVSALLSYSSGVHIRLWYFSCSTVRTPARSDIAS